MMYTAVTLFIAAVAPVLSLGCVYLLVNMYRGGLRSHKLQPQK
jgi:hypothetical protein